MPRHSERMAYKAINTPSPMTQEKARSIALESAQRESSHLFQGLTGSQHAQLWNKAHKTAYNMPLDIVATQVAFMSGLPTDCPYNAANEAKLRHSYHVQYYMACVNNASKDGFQYTLESF